MTTQSVKDLISAATCTLCCLEQAQKPRNGEAAEGLRKQARSALHKAAEHLQIALSEEEA